MMKSEWTIVVACGLVLGLSAGAARAQTEQSRGGKSAAAVVPGTASKNVGDTIELVAKVLRFDPDASEDLYGDGHSARYAATVFEILSPGPLRTKKLVVYHDAPVPRDSLYRAVGKKVRFRVKKASLAPSTQLFTGALDGIVLEK